MWMLPFETYFGMSIKYVNPACLLFIFMNNLQEDLSEPYNDTSLKLYMCATIPLFISLLLLIIPFFTCGAPEIFEHNVNLEFMADTVYEMRLRLNRRIKQQYKDNIVNFMKPKMNQTAQSQDHLNHNDVQVRSATELAKLPEEQKEEN